jgi:hypothetical protein
MKVSDDLTALVFELQRARSPADKARAMARAWRTVRGLNPTERRLLVREVGFDGAEELVEGLAGKSGGAFAPAAVLEALGKMRKDGSLSLRGILTGLRDPETQEDFLARGLDLAADSYDREDEEVDEASFAEEPMVYDVPTARPIAEVDHREPDSEWAEVDEVLAASSVGTADPRVPVIPPPPPSKAQPPAAPETVPEPEPSPRAKEPSPWDAPWRSSPISESAEPPAAKRNRGFEAPWTDDPRETTGSVLDRLRLVRNAIPELRNAGPREIRERLETLPELWARRRAVVDLIDAGIPAGVGETLDLIEDLDRPLDRRWCLSALARRGDLEGGGLDRALAMLASPAARRRVKALATRSR